MKWYLHPQGDEYPTWQSQRIARNIPVAISLQKTEPLAAITGDGWALLPMTDAGPQPGAGQLVDSRDVTVDTEAGTATAGYTYRSKTSQEIATERAIALRPVAEGSTKALYRRRALVLEGQGKFTQARILLAKIGE